VRRSALQEAQTKRFSIHDPLDLVEFDRVVAAIVKSGRAGRFVAGHLLRDFELTAILQVRRDPGSAEAVATDLRPNSRRKRPALNHHVHVRFGQRSPAAELAMPHGREQGSGRLAGQA
jgi:hypothetical protein